MPDGSTVVPAPVGGSTGALSARQLREAMVVTRFSTGLTVVFGAGMLIRVILMPLGHGQDFTVWDLASRATLDGTNIYAHHPAYPGGPYAYFPLFLDIELPFQWAAMHLHVSFTVLGKIPIVAGDVFTAKLIAAALRVNRAPRSAVATGTALYFLNPLVLYDGAYYGRFDSVALALLLAAILISPARSIGSQVCYALAVAAKTFPAFALFGIVRAARERRIRLLVLLVGVLLAVSSPYLMSWRQMLDDIVLYDAGKAPAGLSWQTILVGHLSFRGTTLIDATLLVLLVPIALLLLRVRDLRLYTLAVLIAFLLCSKVVLEQYLVWPIPLLAITIWTTPRHLAVARGYLALLTSIGMLANPDIQPWGRSPTAIIVILAAASLTMICVIVTEDRARGRDLAAEHEMSDSELSIYFATREAGNAMDPGYEGLPSDEGVELSSDEALRRTRVRELTPHDAPIVLVEPDPNWPRLYEREADRIRSVLGRSVVRLEHVGSTSVPGLIAKPIIDVLLVVADSGDEASYVPALETAGYVLKIREPDWFEHRLFKGPGTDINLHVFSRGAEEIQQMLQFRDRLRTCDADRDFYARTKRDLAQRTWRHVQHYAEAKTGVIREISSDPTSGARDDETCQAGRPDAENGSTR